MLQYDFFFFFFTMIWTLDTGSIHQTSCILEKWLIFFGEYLTVYHVVFHTYNMSLRCITGGCSHEHKILLIEACWSFIHLENGTFFSAVFLCCWEIMCIFPSRKASNLPCFSLCLCVYVCKMSCMFGRQLINMI